MKRILFIVIAGTLCGAYAIAQEYKQNGRAVQNMDADGMVAAHPAERIGSKITIVNIDTGKEVEVTVRGRPTPVLAQGVIVDLSPDAWQALGLQGNTQVGIRNPRFITEPVPVARAEPEPEPPPAPPPEPEPQPPPAPPPPEPEPQPPPAPPPPQQVPFYYYGSIQVIPGYPNPYSGKVYRLQVGSFSSSESSVRVAYMLINAGFSIMREMYGPLYRVLVVGIPAAEAASAIQRLEMLGIRQVWVRE